MTKPAKFSYLFLTVVLVLVGSTDLATPLITALFAYFALVKLSFARNKPLTIVLTVVLVLGIFYGFGFFLKQAFVALPHIAEDSIPRIINWAKGQGLELPFTDVDSLKALALQNLTAQLGSLGNFAKIATKEFVLVVIGFVVACSIFINPQLDPDHGRHSIPNNVYSAYSDEILIRFRRFYQSFATVMGAQMTISAINTVLTAIFILSVNLPYAGVVIGLTFLTGLIPIVGNLISNSVIVGIAFSISPRLAAAALIFLIVLHKLEYFLNSKIIGHRIRNPVWLTLLGLIIGDKLMGIPGMIIAPVLLHYIKMESTQIELSKTPPPPALLPAPAPKSIPARKRPDFTEPIDKPAEPVEG